MKQLFFLVLLLFCFSWFSPQVHGQGSCLRIDKKLTLVSGCDYLLQLGIQNPTSGKKSFTITNGTTVTDTVNVNDGETTSFEKTYTVAGCNVSSLKITIYTAPDAGGTDCGFIILPVKTFEVVVFGNEVFMQWSDGMQRGVEELPEGGKAWSLIFTDLSKNTLRIKRYVNGTYFYRVDGGLVRKAVVNSNSAVTYYDFSGNRMGRITSYELLPRSLNLRPWILVDDHGNRMVHIKL